MDGKSIPIGEKCDYVWKGFGDKETHPIYKGEVENGVPNGLGVLIFTKGTKYVGGWKNGEFHGQGKITSTGGSYCEGEYKNGEEWNVMCLDKYGNILYNFVNGKTIKPYPPPKTNTHQNTSKSKNTTIS